MTNSGWLKSMAGAVLMLTACASSPSGVQTEGDGGLTTQVGTVTGNPSFPAKQKLVFSSLTQDSDPAGGPGITCRPLENEAKNKFTQRCFLTPAGLVLGVMAIHAVECLDASANPVACDSPEVAAVGKRAELFRQDPSLPPVRVEIRDGEAEFPKDLSEIKGDIQAGGLQFVLAHMTSIIPEVSEVTPEFRGVPARVCGVPGEILDPAVMRSQCGNAEALRGDILFDADKSGSFEFFSDPWSESRPEDYSATMGYSAIGTGTAHYLPSAIDPNPEFSAAGIYPVEGYYAPIFSFQKTVALSPVQDFTYKVVFNLTDTLTFIDGWHATGEGRALCVQQLAPHACPADADPESVGVYDPRYDGVFHPKQPHVNVGVTSE